MIPGRIARRRLLLLGEHAEKDGDGMVPHNLDLGFCSRTWLWHRAFFSTLRVAPRPVSQTIGILAVLPQD